MLNFAVMQRMAERRRRKMCEDDFPFGTKIAANPCSSRSRPHQRSERDRKTRSDYGLETEKTERGTKTTDETFKVAHGDQAE